MKKRVIFYSAIILTLFFINFVSAFSVATLYGDNYPLKLRPGETKDTFFLVRNVVEGDSDVNVKVELTKGEEVASLVEGAKSYSVAYGDEIEIPVRIDVPLGVEPGTKYYVGALFKPIPGKARGGNIQFLVNIGKSFPVIVAGEGRPEFLTSSSLIVEDEDSLIESFAPMVKGSKGVWVVIVFFLMVGILVIGILIVYFVIHSSKMKEKLEMLNAGNYQQFGNVNGNGNTI